MDSLTKQLLLSFKFQKILGRCPLTFDSYPHQNGSPNKLPLQMVHYRFKIWKDFSFLASALSATFFIGITVFGILQSGSLGFQVFPPSSIWPNYVDARQPYHEKYGTRTVIFLASFEIIYGIQSVAEYFIVWYSAPTLAKWLNNWNPIELQLRNMLDTTLPKQSDLSKVLYENGFDISKFRNYFGSLFIGIPTLVFGSAILLTDLHFDFPVAFVYEFLYSFSSTVCIVGEDVKTVLMFRIIETAMRQVKKVIKSCSSPENETGSKCNYNLFPATSKTQKIREWTKMLVDIRKQSDLAGKYIYVHQLLSIFTLVYFVSSAMYVATLIGSVAMTDGDGFDSKAELVMVIVFSILSSVRLLVKIKMAVRITAQENLIAGLLKDLEISETNELCRYELKSLHEMLVIRPTEISLNNYVLLNNSLILTVLGQIFTIFVVFMQFSRSYD